MSSTGHINDLTVRQCPFPLLSLLLLSSTSDCSKVYRHTQFSASDIDVRRQPRAVDINQPGPRSLRYQQPYVLQQTRHPPARSVETIGRHTQPGYVDVQPLAHNFLYTSFNPFLLLFSMEKWQHGGTLLSFGGAVSNLCLALALGVSDMCIRNGDFARPGNSDAGMDWRRDLFRRGHSRHWGTWSSCAL